MKYFYVGLMAAIISLGCLQPAFASPGTVPLTVAYSARLTNPSGSPIITAQDVRFSLWSSPNEVSGDIQVSGSINTSAPNYLGWTETYTITPDSNGLFQVRLGSINPFPNFNSTTGTYLQVEIENSGLPLTSFEVLHPSVNSDRFPLDSSIFAIDANSVDNHSAGTSSGQIPFLDGSGLLPISAIPGGTNSGDFVLDNNDSIVSPGTIKLQFGNTLNKFLEYNPTAGYFNFNDNVNITGNLTTTGTVNGVTISPTTIGPYNKSLVFDPQYAGGVIQQDVANVGGDDGTLEELFDTPSGINYYHWTTRQSGLQDIFIVIRANVPDGFVSWQSTPIQFNYRTGTASAADNKLDISMTDTSGNPVMLSGASTLTSTSFNTSNITFSGSPTFTPGQPFTITVKLSATNAGSADAARLQLNYSGR